MLRNYITAALANLARNWLYAGITILGLAVSFAAAIVIGLYVRDEYSFERFIPGYQDVYRVQLDLALPGQKVQQMDESLGTVGKNFALDFPEVKAMARLQPRTQALGRGRAQSLDAVGWADPDFFRVMDYPVLAGDPVAALHSPDGLVLTRSMARKYFGEDAPIGKTLSLFAARDMGPAGNAAQPMRVLAVLKDIPNESHLNLQIFGSALLPTGAMAYEDAHPSPFNIGFLTYVRLKPGASAERVRAGLRAFDERHYPGATPGAASPQFYRLVALSDIHFDAKSSDGGFLRQPGSRAVDAGIAAVGGLIILIAAINFVTLMTARATRRAVEVGVRKALGATRIDLVIQFMGEVVIYVLFALLIAVALVELALPRVNAFLDRTIVFDYLRDPQLLAAMVGTALATAVVAGLYPAVVLSSFRPAQALKGGIGRAGGAAGVRQVLVVAQFAILISLIIITVTIYRQTSFALSDALRMNADQVVRIAANCTPDFRQELAAVPGVKAATCASSEVEGQGGSNTVIKLPSGADLTLQEAPVEVGFLEMHGLKPLAGRFFSRDHGEDVLLEQQKSFNPDAQPSVILNESAARVLGYRTAEAAAGRTITWTRWSAGNGANLPPLHSSQVIGVVRDFTLGSIRTPISPTLYFIDVCCADYTLVRLDGRGLPETLPTIDRLWKRTGHDRPIQRSFESQGVQELYRDVYTQGVAVAVCSGLAILIACLGLFALAAFTTERRIKEIGVRKAMGASTFDVVKLLLWQFTKPVLWANLIAWPVAFWAMDQWLHGFAYRVDLPVWLFVLSAGAAVLIAWATVSTHAWLVARARAATALRYE